ncbi:exodeoxyribonuclease VII large subunit [Latilactobacillus curvatus]|uniref:Exodeoxyribonuclease 7 large subunit n=1 Tax=Latilactobacillus curvatus TaxID=28038 RepID=A0ABM7QSW2_LATCU|nr:exodeoxyribonuclease VII large subunit [Latilactobacillus curvatus]EHE86460.1 exodeoxyribonuclease VII, large subunit [Latilactobacillus curvatus CRL 705]MCP8862610.1 exodeoxyribonuclease VII large subunit [Latilactobacillus curvatus]MCP8866661.1 exodeoxyribonuclease VII large subunit [Latilactobacillus curvatus]MCP8870049.1 exodeoxyribonuclease VII large subunit [Latilactobacillus curvatus]MCS6142634.1 exodeoxyribonuclease VII large subunit [Latilactobacillus curvatus]
MVKPTDYLTVTALTQYLKAKFERDPYLDRVYLTGEISNFRLRPNAHQYFSLKDNKAKISAIMFKSAFEKIKFTPEEGMKVLVVGRISLYEATGNYQIYVERMEPDGLGALYQAYEQLKAKLSAEGLFDAPKQLLPRFPKRIAVITSPSGAVIRDIITTTQRRYPIAQLVLFPAVVQGDGAADILVDRLNQVNQQGDFDTIIIGRGGGSIEDLWPFNEERVARAIVASQIPVISSVGHETDTTIADLVADVRAATPTAAAELATPVLTDEVLKLQQQRLRLYQAFSKTLALNKKQLVHLQNSYVLKQPQRLYDGYLQNVDQLHRRLLLAQQQRLQTSQQNVQLLQQRLQSQSPSGAIQQAQRMLTDTDHRLKRAIESLVQNRRQQAGQAVAALDLVSPLKILGRGFAYVTDDNQNVMKKMTDFTVDQSIELHVQDGLVNARVTATHKGDE